MFHSAAVLAALHVAIYVMYRFTGFIYMPYNRRAVLHARTNIPAISHRPSVIDHQSSTISRQPSHIYHHTDIVRHQTTFTIYWLCVSYSSSSFMRLHLTNRQCAVSASLTHTRPPTHTTSFQ